MSRRHESRSSADAGKTSDLSPGLRATERPTAKSQGAPLDKAVRTQMETRFGTEFAAVRIHSDAAAAESARSIGAAAYTVGRDIVFGQGRYSPQSDTGQQLLAHELAHVVQQSRGGSASPDAEAKADRAADQVAQDKPVATGALGSAPVALQAKPDDTASADAGFAFPIKTLSGFALNSAALTATHVADIDALAGSISLHLGIRKDGRATISIVGHTDRSGDEKLNEALGQQRADAARQALLGALKKRGIAQDKVGEIATRSLGESSPAVPTADGVKNEKNRRVEINVSIESPSKTPAKPTFDPFAPLDPGIIGGPPEGRPRPDPGEWWRRAEENQRKIDEFDRKHPRTNKSLSEAVIDKVMEDIVDPLIRKLPVSKDMKDLVRSGARKGLEKGTEAACEAAIDATGLTGNEADALKAACKGALKTKPGGEPPR
jgi:outer membrane protein OmpA-like peptidoglycan-associated protein